MQNLHKSKLLGKHSDFWKCGFLSRGIYLFSSLPAFQFSGDTQTEKRFHGHSWQCTRLTFSWPWLSGPVRRQSVRLCPVMVGCEDVTWLHITQTLHAMGAGRQPAHSAWLRGGFSQGAGSKGPFPSSPADPVCDARAKRGGFGTESIHFSVWERRPFLQGTEQTAPAPIFIFLTKATQVENCFQKLSDLYPRVQK